MVRKRLRGVMVAAAVAAMGRMALADKVDLPERGISTDSQIVLRIDVAALSGDALEKSKVAILGMFGDMFKDEGATTEWQLILALHKGLQDAGVEEVVLVVDNFQNGIDQMKPTVLVKLKAGTEAAAIERALKNSDEANVKAMGGAKEMDQITVKPLGQGWAYVDGGRLTAPAETGDKATRAIFQKALGNQEGAPVRLAFRLNDTMRTNIETMINAPGAPDFVKPLLTGLGAMENASVGIWPGDTVKLKLAADFTNADMAASFKKGVDGYLEVLKAPVLSLNNSIIFKILDVAMTLKQDGATVSNSLDTVQLKGAIKELVNQVK